jgi:hypothetical protein
MNKAEERKLLEGLRYLNKKPDQFVTAKVLEVDESAQTIKADDQFEIYDIRLKSIIDNKEASIIVIPKKSSYVILGRIETQYFVLKVNEIAKILIVLEGGLKIEMKNDSIIINDGKLGGLIKIDDLVSKINNLEDRLKSHQHLYIPYPGGVAGTPVKTVRDIGNAFVNTRKSELENDKIKH